MPNIIVFIMDDLGAKDIGAAGNKYVKTPNIDNLAKDGIFFKNTFLTTSSCSPSRASTLSGMYPHNTGAPNLHDPLPPSVKTIAHYLKEQGFYTVSSGKWHLGEHAKSDFDQVDDLLDPGGGVQFWLERLQTRPKDKPFFFWYGSIDPHRPFGESTVERKHKAEALELPTYLHETPKNRSDYAGYYDEIHRTDTEIGRVVNELKRQGIYENTVILFLSDNGAPFSRAKLTLYDSGVNTPLIVSWPDRITANTRNDGLISTLDIAPTILDIVGKDTPSNMQGRSILPILFDHNKPSQRETVFMEQNSHASYQIHKRAVRTKDYLYIKNTWPKKPVCVYYTGSKQKEGDQCNPENWSEDELFNVNEDADQLNNIASRPDAQKILADMQMRLQAWTVETRDKPPEFGDTTEHANH